MSGAHQRHRPAVVCNRALGSSLALALLAACNSTSAPLDRGYLIGRTVEAVPGSSEVRAFPARVAVASASLHVNSDGAGAFKLGPLPAGHYQVYFLGRTATGDERQRLLTVDLARGATLDLGDVALQQNAQLSGRVLLEGGLTGNAGVTVFVPGTEFVTVTSDTGAWSLRELPGGTVRVSAFRDGFLPATTPDLALQGGVSVTAADLVLRRAPSVAAHASITGAVRVTDKADASAVAVSAISNSTHLPVASVTTGAAGTFTLADLPTGFYAVQASLAGYPTAEVVNLALGPGDLLPLSEPLVLTALGPDNQPGDAGVGAGPGSGGGCDGGSGADGGCAGDGGPGAQCTSDDQCAAGRRCTSGLCVACNSDASCQAGYACRAGDCVHLCKTISDCPPSEVCGVDGTCGPCASSAQCGDPALICNASGACDRCHVRAECPAGKACLPGGCGECSADADCGAGAICEQHVCVAGDCHTDADCPSAQACVGRQCGACTADLQCRAGQLCLGGACRAGDCRAVTDCSAGQVCQGNLCGACAKDEQCGAGQLCLATGSGLRCSPGTCHTAADCAGASSGQVCLGNQCAACTSSAQCAAGQVCNAAGRCVAGDCTSSGDCSGARAGWVCKSNSCTPCANTAECGASGYVCDSGACTPGNCATPVDCPVPGQLCSGHVCGGCSSSSQCGPGRVCDTDRLCKSGQCVTTADCAAVAPGKVCSGLACVACGGDGQCGAGQLCLGGLCAHADCRSNGDCAPGQACVGNLCGACGRDQDCGAGRLCLAGAGGNACTVADCRTAGDCTGAKAGQVCAGNLCTDCSGSGQCAAGQVCATLAAGRRCTTGNCLGAGDCTGAQAGFPCVANLCAPCRTDQECGASGYKCDPGTGVCNQGDCNLFADCQVSGQPAGRICKGHLCGFCAQDGDCPGGLLCKNGLCAASTAHTLAVAIAGSGGVVSSPGAISCASGAGSCAGTFNLGDVVTLTATPAAGFFFGGWSGVPGCGAALACAVTVTGDLAATATFNAGVALSVGTAGPGTVTSSPAAISCPGTCGASFPVGAQVTLTATPVAGYSLGGWSGGGCSGAGPCALTLAQAASVTASFVKQPVLTVALGGPGSGTVTSSPAGISCANGGAGTCSAPFPAGTKVTLTEAASGQPFGGWLSGGCSGTATTCAITLAADTTVSASFGTAYTLTVTASGPGAVSADSGAIANCGTGGACSGGYPSGAVVKLTVTPQTGAAQSSWGGDCAAASGSTCTLAMSQARSATATFTPVTSLSVVQGDQQTAPLGTVLPQSVVIKVAATTGGAPLANAAVALAGPPGSVVTPAIATTDLSGLATFAVRLSLAVGAQSFTASTLTAQQAVTVTATATTPAAGLITSLVGIEHIAGLSGVPGPSVPARINAPAGLAQAADGTIFVAANGNHEVLALSPSGVLSVLAGNSVCGNGPDLGPASVAQLCNPSDLALLEQNGKKTLFVADTGNNRVRAIDLTQSPPTIQTFAGGGGATGPGFGDGGPASSAALSGPQHVALDPAGVFLYVVDTGNARYRRVDLGTGLISAWLSTPSGVSCSAGGSNCPGNYHDCAIGFDPHGAAYVAWAVNNGANCTGGNGASTVYRVGAGGSTTLVAGGGSGGEGSNALGAALANVIAKILFDPAGNLYLVERTAHRVRRVDAASWRITSVAGTGSAGSGGELVDARIAALSSPYAAILDPSRNLIVTDTGNASVRAIWSAGAAAETAGTLSAAGGDQQTVGVDQLLLPMSVKLLDAGGQPIANAPVSWSAIDAGAGLYNTTMPTNPSGVSSVQGRVGLAAGAPFRFVATVFDVFGNAAFGPVTFTQSSAALPSGFFFTSVGTSHTGGYDGLNGAATLAHIGSPRGLALAKDGTLFISDSAYHVVYARSPAGVLRLLAGTGGAGFSGDGGAASGAQLNAPYDLSLDEHNGAKTLYVADSGNNRIRAIDLKQTPPVISTFAGGGPAFNDGGPATSAALSTPMHVAVGPGDGYVYIADQGTTRIRRVSQSSTVISTWLSPCGTTSYGVGYTICQVTWDSKGTPYVYMNSHWDPIGIYKIGANLSQTQIAFSYNQSNTADGIPALGALAYPTGIFFDNNDVLHVADSVTHRIRKLSDTTTSAIVTSVAGTGAAGNGADAADPHTVALSSPWTGLFAPDGRLIVADTGNSCVREIAP